MAVILLLIDPVAIGVPKSRYRVTFDYLSDAER
jgi:hypothetical protein